MSSNNYSTHVAGKKHILKQSIQDKYNKSIFVTDVSNCTTEDVKNIFRKFGEITHIVKNSNQHFSIIRFAEESSVETSLKARVFFGRRKLRVRKYEEPAGKNNNKGDTSKNSNDKSKNTTETSSTNGSQELAIPGQVGVTELPVLFPDSNSCPPDQNLFEWQALQIIPQVELPPERYHSLNEVVSEVEQVFQSALPGCHVNVFGSCGTTLAFRNSDVDLFLQCNGEQPTNFVRHESRALYKCRQINIICRVPTARVPIIKFEHLPTGWQCDLTANSRLGVCNSRLIRFLISLDHRIRPLMMLIKYWAKVCTLTGSNIRMTTYALVMLVVFYLQRLSTPLLPPIALLMQLAQQKEYSLGWECSFCDYPQQVLSVIQPQENKMSLKELFTGFFSFYKDFDYMNVICPLLGRSVHVSQFESPENLPEEMQQYKDKIKEEKSIPFKTNVMLRVQDPFELNLNITKNVADKTFFNFNKACLMSCNISETADEASLLKTLFSIDQDFFKTEQNSFVFNISLKNDAYKTSTDSPNSDLIQMYDLVTECILVIMREVLKLKVEPINENILNKVQKLESSTDVHSSSNSSKTSYDLIYTCTGDGVVWKSRKQVSKMLKTLQNIPLSPFEKDICISNALYQPKETLVSFKLVIDSLEKIKKNPKCLKFIICDPKENEKSHFNEIANFLKYSIGFLVSQTALFIKQTRDSENSSIDKVKESLQNLFELKLVKILDVHVLKGREDKSTLENGTGEKASELKPQEILFIPSNLNQDTTKCSQTADNTQHSVENNLDTGKTIENCSSSNEKWNNPFLASIEKVATLELVSAEDTSSNCNKDESPTMESNSATDAQHTVTDGAYKKSETQEDTVNLDSQEKYLSNKLSKKSNFVKRTKPEVYIERPSYRKSPMRNPQSMRKLQDSLMNQIQSNGTEDTANFNPRNFEKNEYSQRQLAKSTNMHKIWFPTLFKSKQ